MKLKYNDKVLVIKDEENDGFYVGTEGIIKSYRTKGINEGSVQEILNRVTGKIGEVYYEVWLGDRSIWGTEDCLRKI